MANKLTTLAHITELSNAAKGFALSLIGTVAASVAEALEELSGRIPAKAEDIGAVPTADIAKYLPPCPDIEVIKTHVDFDDLTADGFYYIPSGYIDADSHRPGTVANGWLLVMNGSTGGIKQILWRQGSTASNHHETFVRTYSGGVWLDWMRLDQPVQVFSGNLTDSSGNVTLNNSCNYTKALVQVTYVSVETIGGKTSQYSYNDFQVVDLTAVTAKSTVDPPNVIFSGPSMALSYWVIKNESGTGNSLVMRSASNSFKYLVTYYY